VNAQQLIVKLTHSADQHDEGTCESNGDLIWILREALDHLEARGELPAFIERLAQTDLAEVLEFEWLKPDESYVKVENSAETLQLFTQLRVRGFDLAACTIQNSGNIPLADMEKALATITVPDLRERFNHYVDRRFVPGKDADDDRIGAADGSGEER